MRTIRYMAEALEPLSHEQLAEIDAEYVPFPAFETWATNLPRAHVWEKRVAQLEGLAAHTDEDRLRAAIDVAVRAAAFDTGAIEGLYTTDRGLTMTVAQQAFAWEKQVAAHGTDAVALFNAQLATYELVLDVATQKLPVNEAWIRRLHEDLTAPQETYTVHTPVGIQQHPLPRGQYKQYPNHVQLSDGSHHAYAPVDRTRDEMERLVRELQSEEFAGAHPIIQAAYAHYAFVSIHPFADGNGRVARALASAYLYRAARVPFLVFADQREVYFDALAAADDGRHEAFNAFVNNAGIAAVELVSDSVRAASAPSAEAAANALRELVTAQGGLGHTEIDQLAINLISEFSNLMRDEAGKLTLPPGVVFNIGGGQTGPPNPPDKFRTLVSQPGLFVNLQLTSPGPSAASRNAMVRVFISKDLDEESDLYWIVQEGTDTGATFSLTDIQPALSAAAEQRMRILARRILGVEMTELVEEAARALRTSGYVG